VPGERDEPPRAANREPVAGCVEQEAVAAQKVAPDDGEGDFGAEERPAEGAAAEVELLLLLAPTA
jgi:hypothetical protein